MPPKTIKPKVAVKVTKVVAKPTGKMPVKKVEVKSTKVVVKPKIEVKKSMADNTRVKKTDKDFTPAPKYNRLNDFIKGVPTKADSVNYRKGYKIGAAGFNINSPFSLNIEKEMGQREGMDYFKSKSKKKQ